MSAIGAAGRGGRVLSSTAIAVLVTEPTCVSGQDAAGRVESAVVGELEAPLGKRTLVDGGADPPTPAATTSPGG